MSSQPKEVTQKSVKELPPEFQGLLGQYVDQLGNTSVATAPFTEGQQQAVANYAAVGASGEAQLNDALGLLSNTASGAYVGANPYLDTSIERAQRGVVDQYRNATAPGIDADTARAGIFGGSAWGQRQAQADKALAQSLVDTEAQMRGQAYTAERAQQEAAVLNMLNSSDSALKYQQGLFSAYEPVRAQDQANMDEGQRKLAMLNQAIGLGYSGAATSQTAPNPNYVSPFQQLLGVGLMGAGLMTGNPSMVGASKGLI